MQQHRVENHILHEEQILEAIDQLRRRKARPDADRICNYLLRKFSVDARDTIADLHKLIEAEKVIQVDYKGNTSYRNASKWSRLQLYKNRPEGFVKDKLNSAMVAGAVAELVVEEPDYLDQGVPAFRLVEQLLDGISNPTSRRMVEDFLTKETASGNLTRLANGNYSLVATTDIQQETNMDNGGSVKNSKETTTTNSSLTSPYDFDEADDMTMPDSLSNTPRSSRQASPKSEQGKNKDDYYEIIDNSNGKKDDQPMEEREKKEKTPQPSSSSTSDVQEEQKIETHSPNLKKTGKVERKQKLCVRTDDSADIEIKYDDYSRDKIKDYGEKERRDDNGHLSEDRDEEDAGRSSTNPSPTPSNTNAGAFRSARRKRAKKVFDPSDNNLVKRKRGRQPASQNKSMTTSQDSQESLKPIAKDGPNRQCSLCSKEKQESLIACRDCTVRAHPSCVYTSDVLHHKSGSSWQCERCKSCVICCETSDAGPLISCYNCDDAYHLFCHSPRISISKSNSKWNCNDCTQKTFKSTLSQSIGLITNRSESPSTATVLPPVLSPQVSPNRSSPNHMEDDISGDGIDPNIPDASDWTSEQVYQYFARLFPKEAEIFRHQDIDGHSLLMMKRSDVLNRLDLLLGPALKIYRHVLKLQVRRDDPKLYWL